MKPWITLLAACAVAAQVRPPLPVAGNLDGVSDWGHSRWFVDIMRHSRSFGAPEAAWNGYAGAFDPVTRYPTSSFGLVVMIDQDSLHERELQGTYKLSFRGSARVSVSASGRATLANVVWDAQRGRTTADVVVGPRTSFLDLNFFDPVGMDSLRLISPGYPENTTKVLRDEWASHIRDFAMVRTMDWSGTNNNTQVTWADRSLPRLPGATNARNEGVGVPWEVVIAAANQVGKDVWLCLPARATEAYAESLAVLVKRDLHDSLNVYLEYSNEVWNFMFQQFHDNLDSARAEVARGGSPLNADGGTDQYEWARRRVVQRAYRISQAFAKVWGREAINGRVRVMVAGQLPFSHNEDLAWFERTYGPPREHFYGIANAPYFHAHPSDEVQGRTASQLLDQLEANKNALFDQRAMELPAAVASYYGLAWMAYEGGPDTFGPNNVQAKHDLHFDPRMRGIMRDFLDRWSAAGGGAFHLFTIGAGGHHYLGRYGTWPLLHWFDDSAENQKFLGVRDVMRSPAPEVTAGHALPARIPAGHTVGWRDDADSTLRLYAEPSESLRFWYLLNVPSEGAWNLRVSTRGYAGSRIRVLVDGQRIAEVRTKGTGEVFTPTDSVSLRLEKGLSTLVLDLTEVDRSRGGLELGAITLERSTDPVRANPVVRPGLGVLRVSEGRVFWEGATGSWILVGADGRASHQGRFDEGGSFTIPAGTPQGLRILRAGGMSRKILL